MSGVKMDGADGVVGPRPQLDRQPHRSGAIPFRVATAIAGGLDALVRQVF